MSVDPTAARDPLLVVREWHAAVNAGVTDAALALTTPDVELGGPRGTARGHDALRRWIGTAGINLRLSMSFARSGTVVVEQRARWRSPDTGELGDEEHVGSVFTVRDGLIERIVRYPDLDAALAAGGLEQHDAASGA